MAAKKKVVAGGSRAKKKAGRRIDVHNHVIPKEMLDAIAREPARYQMSFEEHDGKRRIVREGGHTFPLFREFSDPAAKIASMDRRGLDIAFISPAPMVFFYWLDADTALDASRIINDGIASMAAAFPDRLRGMGTLPMQDPDAAIAELERIVKDHGFRVIGGQVKIMMVNMIAGLPMVKTGCVRWANPVQCARLARPTYRRSTKAARRATTRRGSTACGYQPACGATSSRRCTARSSMPCIRRTSRSASRPSSATRRTKPRRS